MTEHAPEHRDHIRAADVISLGQLTIRSDRDDEVHTIALVGELDLATADAVQEEFDRVEASDAGAIVVDLSELEFMDSTGVRLLVCAHARSRGDSNRLTLLRGPAAVQRVLELSGVAGMLPFAD